jgi:hypothetical protein
MNKPASSSMRLVFVVYLGAHFRSVLPTASFLLERGYDVLVCFARGYPGWEEDVCKCGKLGFQAVDAVGRDITRKVLPLSKKERNMLRLSARNVLRAGWKLHMYAAHVSRLMKAWRPSAIILPEENIEYLGHVLTAGAAKLGVPSLVLPYSLDNPREACEAYHLHARHRVCGSIRKWFARKHPQWVREYEGVSLFRLPFRSALAMHLCGMAPPAPWQNTCSFATAVVLESAAARAAYVGSSIPAEKFFVTGSAVYDKMVGIMNHVAANRAALLAELGLPPGRRVFLVAIPPDQFSAGRTGSEFNTHEEIVAFWLETLAKTGWNVLVNLHPHLKAEKVHFGSYENVRHCARPTAEVIPLCDVFVASISATIRWAIAAAKPVLNYDFYRYGYDDYRGVPGVVHMTTRAEFNREVAQIAFTKDHLESLQMAQAEVAAHWGSLDGKSGRRLMDLFSLLSERMKSSQQPLT